MSRLLITVCTYNEVENIRLLLPRLREMAPQADILVIDDSSPDGTGQEVRMFAETDSKVHLLTQPGKSGLGVATLAGFRFGIESGYDRLINLDADFSHNPDHIPELLKLGENHDVVIGSRYVQGGGVVGWNLLRHFMSRSINIYARLLLGLRTKDNSGSFRNYRISKLAEVDWDLTEAKGYAFQEEVLYRCQRVGCSFAESPIVFEDRRFGETKINKYEAIAAILVILKLGWQRMLGRRVRRVETSSDC